MAIEKDWPDFFGKYDPDFRLPALWDLWAWILTSVLQWWIRRRFQEMSTPTHYILVKPSGVFVKEASFFRTQGGLTQEWGKHWRPVVASSIENARLMGASAERRPPRRSAHMRRKVVSESPSSVALYVSLTLSCGHKAEYPIWRSHKGPSYRPKSINCPACVRVSAGAS